MNRYSAVSLGFFLGTASACGGSDGLPTPPSAAGAAGANGSAQAGSGSLPGQGGVSGSLNGAAGSNAAGSSAAGSGAAGTPGLGGGSNAGGGSGGAGVAGSSSQAGASSQAGSAGSGASAGAGGGASTAHFSFFVTSLEAIRRESKSENGYGGNLGGLAGADAICTRIAEASLPGSGAKGWKAFLSTSTVNAIERIGTGPWYDRNDKLVASNSAGLLQERPTGGTTTLNDLPNELGVPNRAGTGTGMDDNHDTITGSNTQGKWDGGPTCSDWTSATGSDGPRVGHSWPATSGKSWIQAHTAPGCEPSVALVQSGAGSGNGIGNGGGYGGFYCFALMP